MQFIIEYPTNEFKFDNYIVCNKFKRELFSSLLLWICCSLNWFLWKMRNFIPSLKLIHFKLHEELLFFVESLLSSAPTKQFPMARLISRIKQSFSLFVHPPSEEKKILCIAHIKMYIVRRQRQNDQVHFNSNQKTK